MLKNGQCHRIAVNWYKKIAFIFFYVSPKGCNHNIIQLIYLNKELKFRHFLSLALSIRLVRFISKFVVFVIDNL